MQEIWNRFIARKEKKIFVEMSTEILGHALGDQIQKYSNLLGTLNCVWLTARGKETGLLPSQVGIQQLEKAAKLGKEQWVALGISTH